MKFAPFCWATTNTKFGRRIASKKIQNSSRTDEASVGHAAIISWRTAIYISKRITMIWKLFAEVMFRTCSNWFISTAILEEIKCKSWKEGKFYLLTDAHMVILFRMDIVTPRFYWKTIKEDVDSILSTCDRCQINNRLQTVRSKLHPVKAPETPFELWSIDLTGIQTYLDCLIIFIHFNFA